MDELNELEIKLASTIAQHRTAPGERPASAGRPGGNPHGKSAAGSAINPDGRR